MCTNSNETENKYKQMLRFLITRVGFVYVLYLVKSTGLFR